MTKIIATIALGAVGLGLVAQPAAAQSPSDRDIAKAGVFQAGDFPAGWRATPHKKSKDPFKCPEVEKAHPGLNKARTRTAKANGDDYHQGVEQFSSGVVVGRTEDVTHRAYKAVVSNDMRRCLKRNLEDELKSQANEKGADVKVEVGTVTGSGSYGDESANIGLKMTVSQGSLSQDVFADIVFVRVARSLGFYTRVATSEPTEFDTPTFDGLITSATGRMTAATGGQKTTATTQSS
jgi:hypothetical protein